MTRLLACCLGLWLCIGAALAQGLSTAPAPVTSVTGQTGAVWQPTICGAPVANSVSATTETAFTATCIVPAPALKGGVSTWIHIGGLYTAGAAQNARGRVRYTQSGAPAATLASDPLVVDTGNVGGLAASSNQGWYGDLWITYQAGATTMDVQGSLVFQAATTFTDPIANTTTFPVDPTKDLLFYVTVQWGGTGNSMQLRTLMAK